jgi:hypothetical protein
MNKINLFHEVFVSTAIPKKSTRGSPKSLASKGGIRKELRGMVNYTVVIIAQG